MKLTFFFFFSSMFFSMKDKRLFPQAGEFKQLSMRGWQWCLCCWVADLCVKNPLKDERNQSGPLEGSRRWLLVCWWWQMKPNGFEGGWAAQRVTVKRKTLGLVWRDDICATYKSPYKRKMPRKRKQKRVKKIRLNFILNSVLQLPSKQLASEAFASVTFIIGDKILCFTLSSEALWCAL